MNRLQFAAVGVFLLLPLLAAADRTALRAGLWEVTFTSNLTSEQARALTGRIPEALLAEVPAPQRADFKHLYESGELLRNALNTTDTLCITEDELEHGIQPAIDIDDSCTMLSATTHKAWQEVHFVCNGPDAGKGKAVLTIAVSDPTTFTGTISRTVTTPARPFNIKVAMQGKWLDSQCGEEAAEEDESRR